MSQPCLGTVNMMGLYSTGELYHITTTHNVASSTGALLDKCKITFKTSDGSFSLGYDLATGWYEEGDDQDLSLIHI